MAQGVKDKILSYLKVKFEKKYTEEEMEKLADELFQLSEMLINLYEFNNERHNLL